jgi:hypothetical protein
VVDGGLGKHGVVLEERLPERRGVVGNHHEFCLSRPEALQRRLVAKSDLARLDDEGELRSDAGAKSATERRPMRVPGEQQAYL